MAKLSFSRASTSHARRTKAPATFTWTHLKFARDRFDLGMKPFVSIFSVIESIIEPRWIDVNAWP